MKLAASLFSFCIFRHYAIVACASAATLNSGTLINEAHVRPLILACIAVYAFAMAGVSFAAHGIVDRFGNIGGLVTIAAMYGTARWYDHRARR
jgi:uncharacterized membrane protein YhiD involved in acid resistance